MFARIEDQIDTKAPRIILKGDLDLAPKLRQVEDKWAGPKVMTWGLGNTRSSQGTLEKPRPLVLPSDMKLDLKHRCG